MIPKVKELKDFLKIISRKPAQFLLAGFILSFLPGQNFYQTTSFAFKKPLIQPLLFNLPPVAFYPVKITSVPPPSLSAGSALVLDPVSGVILYEKNPNERFSPASTTKIMTALVALEKFNPDEILTVKTVEKTGRIMGLKEGERLTFENLLYGLLVHSANDAAVTLAENYPGGRESFISAMNRVAKKLNMKNTHFVNETGFEQDKHYISSIDLARLATFALENPIFLKTVETKKITVWDVTKTEAHLLENVNKLLGEIPGLYGVKTGWTENAGECLVAATEREGRKIITVVLKSADRFGETEKLVNWAFLNHRWITPYSF